jgi:hypothetical protein
MGWDDLIGYRRGKLPCFLDKESRIDNDTISDGKT